MQQRYDSLPHLGGRFIGKCQSQNRTWSRQSLFDNIGNAVSQDPRLAATGSGQY
jgi:hypothetical protein